MNKLDSSAVQQIIAAATKLRVRSALNPALWNAAIISTLCFVFALIFKANQAICATLIYFGLIPIALVPIGFIYFMIFNPDALRSEEFQLKKISMIAGKFTGVTVPANEVPLVTAGSAKE